MTVSQLDSLITLLRSRPAPATQDVNESRARFEKMGGFLGGAPDAKCEKVDVDGVPAEWVSAADADAGRAVLYLHGGGYAIGSINTHRRLAFDVSAASGARVLLLDYRLAPEHPFPAAVDDAADGVALAAEAGLRRHQAGDRRQLGRWRTHRSRRWSTCATGSSACRPAPWRSRHGSISRASAPA